VQKSLDRRIDEIHFMERKLDACRSEVRSEMDRTVATIEKLNAYIQYVHSCPQPTCADNLKLREGRTNIDRVKDVVEVELRNEMSLLDRVMKELTAGLSSEKKTLGQLKKCEQGLTEDFDNKDVASDVDVGTRGLHKQSETLRNFRDTVTLSPERPLMPTTWSSNTEANIKMANNVVGEAGAFGKSMCKLLDNSWKSIQAQWATVDNAFALRHTQLEDARLRDEIQIESTKQEIKAERNNINMLEDNLYAKEKPLELTTTRLSTRTTRPVEEQTLDRAHLKLVAEANHLDHSKTMLNEQLKRAKVSLDQLIRTYDELMFDLDTKNNSLRIEDECIALRADNKKITPPRDTTFYVLY